MRPHVAASVQRVGIGPRRPVRHQSLFRRRGRARGLSAASSRPLKYEPYRPLLRRIEPGKASTPADAAERECRARPAMGPIPAKSRGCRRASGGTRIRRAGAIEAQNESASMIPFPCPVAVYNIGRVVALVFGLSDLFWLERFVDVKTSQ
jgi:hypothetical protein